MKKSNVTLIATTLVLLHIVVFAFIVGSSHDEPPTRAADAPAPPPAQPTAAEEPILEATVKIPELQLPKPAELVMPVEVVDLPPTQPKEPIARPGIRKGYLRADRPANRTKTIFPKLIGDPYRSAIVVDARTGKILYENRAATYGYPASVTKLMTLLIVLEQIDAGIINLTDKVKINKEIAGIGGSEIYLDVRESGAFTVDDMLKALMIHSANDAARALAIHVAGSRDAFVDMMNQKARELGMNSTIYHTEHGLPPSDGTQPDISTAYDIAILSLAALRHPETLTYTGTKLTYLPLSPARKERFMLANRNALVGKERYDGCDGLKTGYHSKGGWSLAATAKRGDQRIISVILGSPAKAVRNATTKKLLDRGFEALNP